MGFVRLENLQRRKKGWYKCMFENCEFKTYHKERIKKQEIHKHSKEPKKMYTCDGCGWKTSLMSRMMKHSRSCIQFIGRKQRVVPVVKNSETIVKKFAKNLKESLKESVEALSEWYSSDKCN